MLEDVLGAEGAHGRGHGDQSVISRMVEVSQQKTGEKLLQSDNSMSQWLRLVAGMKEDTSLQVIPVLLPSWHLQTRHRVQSVFQQES